MKARIPRYILMPVIIFIYAAVIAWINRDGFISPTSRPTYIMISVAEMIAIVALFFLLRKKEKLKRQREEGDK